MIFFMLHFALAACNYLHSFRRVAFLSDKHVSKFLTDSIIVPAISTTGIMLFFALDPIRCWAENPDERAVCTRTLLGQAGLGAIVLFNLGFSGIKSIFPNRIIVKHTVSVRQVATGDLTTNEALKMPIIAVVVCCSFFQFAQYNARGEMHKGEFVLLILVATIGVGSLVLFWSWEWIEMAKESQELEESGEGWEDDEDGNKDADVPPVLRLNRGFQASGMVFLCVHTALGTLGATTLDHTYGDVQYLLVPFTVLFGALGFMSDPRSGKKIYEITLILILVVGQIPSFCFSLQQGSNLKAGIHLMICVAICMVAPFGFMVREKMAALKDVDLNNFFLKSVLENSWKNISGMLFVGFKALNCVMENRSFEACDNTIFCCMFLSVYLVAYTITKAIAGAVPEQQKHRISWEKLATMRQMSKWHAVQGSLSGFTLSCGMFLFCMMNAAEKTREKTILSIGVLGTMSIGIVLLIEVFGLLKPGSRNEADKGVRDSEADGKIIVTEIDGTWVRLGVMLTTTYTLMYLIYAIFPVTGLWVYGQLLFPTALLGYGISFFMKPLKKDKKYTAFLVGHFCQTALITEILGAVGNLRDGKHWISLLGLLRIPIYIVIFKEGLKVRRIIALLPEIELSNFLVFTLLAKGAACFTSIMFFTFEILSCWLQADDRNYCANTSYAALFLSSYVVVLTCFSIVKGAAPEAVWLKMAMTKERLASLNLTKKETLQFGCFAITSICALGLFSSLVAAQPNDTNLIVGMIGVISMLVAFIVEFTVLVQAYEADELRSLQQKQIKDVKDSSSEVKGNMELVRKGMIQSSPNRAISVRHFTSGFSDFV